MQWGEWEEGDGLGNDGEEEQIVVQNVRESSPPFFFLQRDTDAMIALGQDGEARQSSQDQQCSCFKGIKQASQAVHVYSHGFSLWRSLGQV